MDTPNDIDSAIVGAKLDGLNLMYSAAVDAYRQGIVDTLAAFAMEFVYEVHAVRLIADVDWRWCFDGFVDAAGEDIDADMGDYLDMGELFDASTLSELNDFESGTGYVYVATREFSHLGPQQYALVKAVEHADKA